MLITCPNCKTTYNVPSLMDHPEKKVRCAQCGNVWEPASDIIDPLLVDFELMKPAPSEGRELPASAFQDLFKAEKKENFFLKWLKPLYFISLFFIALSIYLFFFHTPKRASVTLQTISYEMVQKDYKTYLLLQAAAFNNTDKEIRPQTFSVRFVDEKDRTLTTTSVTSPLDVLPAHGVEKIDIQIERPPSKTAKVILTLTKMKTL